MTEVIYPHAKDATTLCKACGLCCTGHLFSWVRLKASELTPSEKLGLNVIRNDPTQRGFTQPCPVWNGICAVYDSPHYPKGCRSYKCKLLRELLDESVSLTDACQEVDITQNLIRQVEAHLPQSIHSSFRERFIAQVKTLKESGSQGHDLGFNGLAERLLDRVENIFGVKDFFEKGEEN